MDWEHHHFESLSSTNEWAKKNFNSFDRNKITLITASSQTHGRGQYGKRWISPPHLNFYGSFCFLIEKERIEPLSLTHLLAISTIGVLKEFSIFCQIKWPNDILVNKKKIAGILCETVSIKAQLGIVLGIGVNLNMPLELLQQIDQPATSILNETKISCDQKLFTEQLKNHFQKDLTLFFEQGFYPFFSHFHSALKIMRPESTG